MSFLTIREAAIAAVELTDGNVSPILLLVAGTVASAGGIVLAVIKALRLLKSDAAAELHAGKRFSDDITKGFPHSVREHSPKLKLSHPADGTRGLQPRRSRRAHWSSLVRPPDLEELQHQSA